MKPGTFRLASSSDTNIAGDLVTSNNLPTFTGSISTLLGNIVPLANQTVFIDVSTKGDGVYNLKNAGTAFTDAQGNFSVKVGTDAAGTKLVPKISGLPDSITTFNTTTRKYSGSTLVRVRIVDQSGNATNLPTDSDTQTNASAKTRIVIDTASPKITAFTPSPSRTLTPDASGGVTFSFQTNEYLDRASLNASNIVVKRAGADGVIGTTDDVVVPVAAGSITTSFISGTKTGALNVKFRA